jgi:UDP-N-acetylmuramoyl-tripeptide--D-alanyl-D-alanine ligase
MTGPALWTAADAARATGGLAGGEWRATGVSVDSRSLAAGDLFVALKGSNFDGHAFAAGAMEAGAAAVMIECRPEELAEDAACLRVADTRAALEALGRAARNRSQARVAAVTGSVGKTSSKEMLHLALESSGLTHANTGSLNNHIGVPLSLARLPADAAFGVFEAGMNHPGELTPLSELIAPDVALITTVEAVHLAAFASVAEIADAKAEIFAGMNNDGIAVLNRDNPQFDRLADAARARGLARIVGFGTGADADARLLNIEPGMADSTLRIEIDGRPLAYRLALPGRHMALNSVGVLAAAQALGAELDAAAAMLGALKPLPGRGARHSLAIDDGMGELIDESYNASPASVRAALEVLAAARPGAGGRRIAVLGDMLELGPEGPALHAGLASAIEATGIDFAFTCGEQMSALREALPASIGGAHAADSEALAPLVLDTLVPGDLIMVKGSLGSRMGLVVDALLRGAAAPPSRRVVNG